MVQGRVGAAQIRDEQVEEPVVVVIAHGDRCSGVHGCEAACRRRVFVVALAEVVEQPQSPVGPHDHEIGVAVTVEVPERRVAAPLPDREAHRGGHLPERAVELLPIGAVPRGGRQQQIEVAVVIEVEEQRLPGGGHGLGEAGRRRDVAKPAAADIVQECPASGSRDVEVESSVVVVIGESSCQGALA